MKVLTGTQMAEIDRKAIDDHKIDGLILMENAGLKVFEEIMDLIANWHEEQEECFKNVVVVCGKGNNGGDGFVIARHLIQNKIPTMVFAVAESFDYSGDALKNYLALENFGDINIITEDTLEDFEDLVLESSLIVDALLGTGLKGNVEGIYSKVIEVINATEGVIVAVDIPSGVEADTGRIASTAVEADLTVTFAVPKLGHLLYPGADHASNLQVVDIGIPEFLIENSDSKIHITEEDYVFNLLPWRPEDTHKGTYGKVLTIAGSRTMTGAGLLSSLSVLKIGAGLSTLASPESLIPYYVGHYPEITYLPLKETAQKTLSAQAFDDIKESLPSYQAVILGPGMGLNDDTIEFTKLIIEELNRLEIPVVVDADALNCMAKLPGIKLTSEAVITPHPRELSRLLDVELEDLLDDKIKYLNMAAEKYDCNVVLKGSNTLIGCSDLIFINTTGNPGLAKGGTGDVLSGIIGGLIAQGLPVFNAAILGVYIHGLSADIALEDTTEYSLLATDVIDYIPDALQELSVL